jgi:hypothetical protein
MVEHDMEHNGGRVGMVAEPREHDRQTEQKRLDASQGRVWLIVDSDTRHVAVDFICSKA